MKVSDLTLQNVADYLRTDDTTGLQMYLDAAKKYISDYTGLPLTSETEGEKTVDDYEDITIAVLAICQDMHDNRAMQIEKNNVNKVIESTLDMHRRNLV